MMIFFCSFFIVKHWFECIKVTLQLKNEMILEMISTCLEQAKQLLRKWYFMKYEMLKKAVIWIFALNRLQQLVLLSSYNWCLFVFLYLLMLFRCFYISWCFFVLTFSTWKLAPPLLLQLMLLMPPGALDAFSGRPSYFIHLPTSYSMLFISKSL